MWCGNFYRSTHFCFFLTPFGFNFRCHSLASCRRDPQQAPTLSVDMSAYKSKSNIQRDPNNGLQMALDDAIKFAATHRKGKDMTRDLSDVKQVW